MKRGKANHRFSSSMKNVFEWKNQGVFFALLLTCGSVGSNGDLILGGARFLFI